MDVAQMCENKEPLSQEGPIALGELIVEADEAEKEVAKATIRTPVKSEGDHYTCIPCRAFLEEGSVHPPNGCSTIPLREKAARLRAEVEARKKNLAPIAS